MIFFIHGKLIAKPNKAEANNSLASALFVIQKKDSLLIKYKEALKLLNEEDYSNSLEKGLVLLAELKKTNFYELKYLCNFLIGDCFLKMKEKDKAVKYFKRSLFLLESNLFLFKEENPTYGEINVFHELKARNLLRLGTLYARAEKKDSAVFYYQGVIGINSFGKKVLPYKASAFNNLSGLYIKDSSYVLAKNYALKAVEIRRKNNNKVSEAIALSNLANIHVLEKDYIKAKEIYKKAITLIEFNKSSKAIRYKENLYYNLAWALYNLEDFTAYNYQEKSYLIKDSLRNAEFEHIVQQVYEKYQADIAKKQADKAEANVKLKELEEKKTTIFFTILIFLVLVSSGVILYNYKLRQNNLKLKLDQTELAQKNKLEKLKSESQVRILNATLDGKEAERKQIAETLHDSVSSLLSSANLHLQATKMQFNGDTPIEVDKTQKIIVEASQTIRDLSHTLVSSILLKFGLKYAIIDMADKFSNSQITFDTDIENVRRYHQGFEIKVNNIIQEFVNNILKHSNATKALVKIKDVDGKLLIHIQDNGTGFDKTKIPEKDGLGINQIDARIQMMKGDFHIESNSDNGTKIDIVLPVLERETIIRA